MAMDQERVVKITVQGDTAVKQIDKLSNSLKKAENNIVDFDKTTVNAKKNIGGVGRGAGQAGIQLQQFIGQVQGGQSAMLALSQQSADLGFVLGAPLIGAVVGISASIAGMLLPNLFKTNELLLDISESSGILVSSYSALDAGTRAIADATLAATIEKQEIALAELNDELFIQQERMDQVAKTGTFFDIAMLGSAEAARQNGEHVGKLSQEQLELSASATVAQLALDKLYKTQKDLIRVGNEQTAKIGAAIDKPLVDFNPTPAAKNPFKENQNRVIEQAAVARAAMETASAEILTNTAITQEQKNTLTEQAGIARSLLEIEINRSTQEAIARDNEMFNKAKLAAAASVGASLMSIGQGQSKKLFKIGKALSLASAVASLPNAVMKSYENGGGYPWGIPAAIAMGAAGLAQINNIKKTQYNSGGGSSASVAAPAAASSSQTFAPPTQNTQTENTSQNEILNILSQWNGSQFIPIEVARGIALSLADANRQGGF